MYYLHEIMSYNNICSDQNQAHVYYSINFHGYNLNHKNL